MWESLPDILTAVFVGILAFLALLSHFRIGKEKDATIEKKDATIENLKEQIAALDRFRAKEFVEDTEGRIQGLEAIVKAREDSIAALESCMDEGTLVGSAVDEWREEAQERQQQIQKLKADIATLRRTADKPEVQEFTAAAVRAMQTMSQDIYGEWSWCPNCAQPAVLPGETCPNCRYQRPEPGPPHETILSGKPQDLLAYAYCPDCLTVTARADPDDLGICPRCNVSRRLLRPPKTP